MEGTKTNWREQEFLTVRQVAEIFSIRLNWAYQFVHEQKHVKVGGSIRLRSVYLDKYIKDLGRGK